MSTITAQQWKQAALDLGVSVAHVRAVAEVETMGAAMLPGGKEPRILFERHKFSKHTGGRYDKSHPDISNPVWGGYGKESQQHARLQRAAALDRDAALMSASWGMFQILGENYKQAGFGTLQAFINAMYAGEPEQLRAFVNFIRNDSRLLRALRERKWATFARIYNGPGYKKNRYDIKLQGAYAKWAGGTT